MILLVDEEFEALIPPLQEEQFNLLRENIVAAGRILDPIKVWLAPDGSRDTIIDGHNRYRIYRTASPPLPDPPVELIPLADREAVKHWMRDNQRGRRNLSPDQQLMLDVQLDATVAYASALKLGQCKQILAFRRDLAESVISGKRSLGMAYKELLSSKAAPPSPTAMPAPGKRSGTLTGKPKIDKGRIHVVIGDTQSKPGVPTGHLAWIGQYIAEQFGGQKDVAIIHLGDHWDMPSLSSYDFGKRSSEGRRYKADIEAGNAAMTILTQPILDYNKGRKVPWKPEMHFLMGNHEDRITRATNDTAHLEGTLSLKDLNAAELGWTVHDFTEVLNLDGIAYSHYFYNPGNGRPYSGANLETRLKSIGRSFTMGHQQGINVAMRSVGDGRHHGLVLGSCLTPDHRVLTSDLRYVPLGEVQAGDELVSFDEHLPKVARRGRAFKTGKVTAVRRDVAPVFKVTLSDGAAFKVTADHQWLTKCANGKGPLYTWRSTDSLRKGTRIAKPLEDWREETSYEAGWLSGMYDGEGCYYARETTRGRTGQLTVTQNRGAVLERARVALSSVCGVESVTDTTDAKGAVSLRIRGGIRSIAKVLGQLRPTRLLPKFRPEHLGQFNTTDEDNPAVVSIEPLGEQEIVRIAIDAKTMIVEGYAHHNCYLHDEDYLGPQTTSYWRGIVVCHQVENGSYDIMTVSLEYLCRRYEGMTIKQYLAQLRAKTEGAANEKDVA